MPDLVAVFGETGSGKTELAERWASERGAQLVNFDAFQMVRGFDIGTSTPTNKAAYEMLDILDPEESSGVGRFIADVHPILARAFEVGQDVVLVGGTGLYGRALTEEWADLRPLPDEGLREQLEARLAEHGLGDLLSELDAIAPGTVVDRQNPVRVRRALERALQEQPPVPNRLPPFRVYKVAPQWDVSVVDLRLAQRLEQMWTGGWIEEVAQILKQKVPLSAPAFRAIGYSAIASFLLDVRPEPEVKAEILLETRQYAKRQRTWLRKEPRLHWIPGSELGTVSWPSSMSGV